MAMRSRFTRPPTHTYAHAHSSAVSFTPFLCLLCMNANTYTQCTRNTIQTEQSSFVRLSSMVEKEVLEKEILQTESGKAASKTLPHVRLLAQVPTDVRPARLCV